MKKILLSALTLALSLNFAFAGDAAVFSDIGFSEDGLTYLFGQYGKTDKNYEAWAEIYTVDVRKNDFVKNEVFKTEASKNTGSISGKKAYEELREKTEWKLAKYKAQPAGDQTLLYLREVENKNPTAEIVFKDFEASTPESSVFYHIKLVPTFYGKGKNVKSKYYIDLKKKDENGNLIGSWKVGTPEFQRKGISNYQIDRIFSDKSGKSLVFIVEKTLEDDTGTSIRYMVETVRF